MLMLTKRGLTKETVQLHGIKSDTVIPSSDPFNSVMQLVSCLRDYPVVLYSYLLCIQLASKQLTICMYFRNIFYFVMYLALMWLLTYY